MSLSFIRNVYTRVYILLSVLSIQFPFLEKMSCWPSGRRRRIYEKVGTWTSHLANRPHTRIAPPPPPAAYPTQSHVRQRISSSTCIHRAEPPNRACGGVAQPYEGGPCCCHARPCSDHVGILLPSDWSFRHRPPGKDWRFPFQLSKHGADIPKRNKNEDGARRMKVRPPRTSRRRGPRRRRPSHGR
jgi:hypothetical protein